MRGVDHVTKMSLRLHADIGVLGNSTFSKVRFWFWFWFGLYKQGTEHICMDFTWWQVRGLAHRCQCGENGDKIPGWLEPLLMVS